MAAMRVPRPAPPADVRQGHLIRRTALIAVVVLIGFQVMDGLAGERGFLALMQTRRQHARLAAEVAIAKSENERLRDAIRRLTDDPAAIEELARREFGLIRPGEHLFIIRDISLPARQ